MGDRSSHDGSGSTLDPSTDSELPGRVCLSDPAPPAFPDCDPKTDAHVPYNGTAGSFGPVQNSTVMFQGHPIVLIAPQTGGPFPLMVFMHGSTGQIEMYAKNLNLYANHGFVVAFPYVKDPEKDKNPLTTNTDGEYILRAIDYVNGSQTNSS